MADAIAMAEVNPIPESVRDNPLMLVAWRDCLMWAATFEPMRQQFTSDTGLRFASTDLEIMIDDATGNRSYIATRFIEWFNENIWEEEGGKHSPDGMGWDEN